MKKLIFTLFLLIPFLGYAQEEEKASTDLIFTNDLDSFYCKIETIGTNKITYHRYEYAGNVLFEIKKSKVKKIVFANGKTLILKDDATKPVAIKPHKEGEFPGKYSKFDKKDALKMDMVSLFMGMISFSYEHSLKRGMSVEIGAGYIFAPPFVDITMDHQQYKGFSFRGGFKFITSSDEYLKKTAHPHILKGLYVMPELMFSSYNYTNNYNGYNQIYSINSIAFTVNIGNQFVFNNNFLINWFVGVGLGESFEGYDDGFYYTHVGGYVPTPMFYDSFEIPFAFTAGFKMGFLL